MNLSSPEAFFYRLLFNALINLTIPFFQYFPTLKSYKIIKQYSYQHNVYNYINSI